MTNEQAEQLMRLHSSGYVILVNNRYNNLPVEKLYKEGEDILFHSPVYANASMLKIRTEDVTVSKPLIDWWNQPIG